MTNSASYPGEVMSIVSWSDVVIDGQGYDPRSGYVEEFWLGVLGPSTTWLLRRLAASFDEHPEGFELSLGETARVLGLGDRGGRHSPLVRSLGRLVLFGLAEQRGLGRLAVCRRLPPLNGRQLARLGPERVDAHRAWRAAETVRQGSEGESHSRQARQLALSLVELGEPRDAAERQLLRWRYHPAVVTDAVAWAWARHCFAQEAAREG